MLKIGKKARKGFAFFEMFLLVSFSFAISFFMNAGVVGALPEVPPSATTTSSGFPQSIVDASGVGSGSGGVGGAGGAGGPIGGGLGGVGGAGGGESGTVLAAIKTNPYPNGVPRPDTVGGTLGGLFKGTLFGTQNGFAIGTGAIVSGAVWGGIVYGATLLIADALGLSEPEAKSIAAGLGLGTFAGASAYLWSTNAAAAAPLTASGAAPTAQIAGIGAGTASFLIGGAVAAIVIFATYKKQKVEIVQFECLPWEAPLGGSQCEVCNEDPLLPCSEYRCKSLGQACELINVGSEEEKCVWINRQDTQAPKITPSEDLLSPEGLQFEPDTTISPPNTGFRILNNGDCLDPFSKFEFGFMTDEPAQCKTDLELKPRFDDMSSYFGSKNLFVEEHTQQIKVPSPFSEVAGDVPDIHNNGIYTIWTRCIDANGNGQDSAAVAFRFCVNPGPDLREPIIEGFSIVDGSPVRFDVDSTPIEVYTNEPAECRWSRQDKAFDAMENPMECATETYQINSQLNYVCAGALTGIQNRQANNFYFRCKDQPNKPENERNTMTESKSLLLQGTEELVITNVGPSGVFEGGGASVVTVNLTVETGHGANDGAATCYFSDIDEISSFRVPMQGAGTHMHSQPLDLIAGDYHYYFRCIDAGGNSAVADTTFSVEIDSGVPEITRAFRDRDSLKIITNEDAKCVYSLNSCNYNIEEVTETIFRYESAEKRTVHISPWAVGETYYVKCADFQGNQPAPTQCQLIVQGSDL